MESHSALFATVGAWIAQDPDAATRNILQELLQAQDVMSLKALFSGRIAFGTAGLRAIMGPGPMQMNRLVVRQSVLGVLDVLADSTQDLFERGVVVGYDGRKNSHIFALDAAGVLVAQGVPVHLFEAAVPTPVAGFAVKSLRAAAGLVVTASHNPPAYNGLKVFWHDAAQIVPPIDGLIAKAIDAVARGQKGSMIECLNAQQMRATGRLCDLGQDVIDRYVRAILALLGGRAHVAEEALCLAYTPLHGVGAKVAEAALTAAGFKNVFTVASQRAPDGTFPTVVFPNPEEEGSMDAVLQLAESCKADLACANDPDADRLAVAARDARGQLRRLTGDELGLLLADDAMRRHQDSGSKHKGAVGTTLVSGRALSRLAERRGVHYFETLTGFKWLAKQAREQSSMGHAFLFAYEEALGYALGDAVWDKDGISSLVAVAKLAASLQQQQQTLWCRLEAIAREVGIAISSQMTVPLLPEQALAMMQQLRAAPPRNVGDFAVTSVIDLMRPEVSLALGLPKADVLMLQLQQGQQPNCATPCARIIVRPSGTEPKVKCYYDLVQDLPETASWGPLRASAIDKLEALMRAHKALIKKN